MPSSVSKSRPTSTHRKRPTRSHTLLGRPWQFWAVLSYFAAWFSYFAFFWSRAIFFDERGNLLVGHINIWGDWAVHFTMGSSLAYRGLLLTQSPLLAGATFSYPYLANAVSAILIQAGTPFFLAFTVPSFICSCVAVIALFYFFKTTMRSRSIAILASLIFLLNGGLGFFYFGRDILQSAEPLQTLLNPPHEYTRLDIEHIKWISVIDSMLIPQRALALGFPMALFALALIYSVVFRPKLWLGRLEMLRLVAAGVLLGILPLAHTHSFLASGIILIFWLVGTLLIHRKTKLKEWFIMWLIIGGISLSIAVPIFYYFFFNQAQGFIHWYPGWLARELNINWWVFWFKNWFLTPVLALLGWIILLNNQKVFVRNFFTWVPFILLFILANLFLFQPYSWDNTKIIAWSSVGISALVGWLIFWLWRSARNFKRRSLKRWVGMLLAVIIFSTTIASGTIDLYWINRIDLHSFQMYSAEDLKLAKWVKEYTPVDSVWLTGDYHNHWLFNLTGRQAVATYPGWLWTHGYDYTQAQADVTTMYQLPHVTEVYDKYGVDYVVVGPEERRKWLINEPLSNKTSRLVLIKETPSYQIFEYLGE